MAYTVEQYNTLTSAIASGALSVMYGNKSVTYKNTDDMLRIKAAMEKELFPATIAKRFTRRYASFSKGLNGSFSPEDAEYKY